MRLPDILLDITDETCPMTFVRTKLSLERLLEGQVLRVRLREGEPAINVPRAVVDHGYRILNCERAADGIIELEIARERGA